MIEALDIERPDELITYLRQCGRLLAEESPDVEVLAGGVSNRTVLVRRESGEAWVLKQALAKLRVKVDWFSSPERIHREALGLRWLGQFLPDGRLPDFLFEDHDFHVLAMQAVPQPHVNWKTMLLAGEVNADHVRQFAAMLGTIHRESYLRRAEVAPIFDDRSFFESLRLEPYYTYTGTQVLEAAPFLDRLVRDTLATRLTIVHGDYSPKNVLVYEDRLILLDFEVIHFGDPGFDLGFSLTHLLSKAHHVPGKRVNFADAARMYWQTYLDTIQDVPWRADLEPRAVRHTLACLLARVAGRSPLEYLNPEERETQRTAVLGLFDLLPITIPALVDSFIARLP